MVVDDEADISCVIKRGLEQNGFEADAFNNPEEALKNFKPSDYDLLLIDVKMPKINGFELYRVIKKIDSKVKVCFITAFEIYYDEFRKVFPMMRVSCFIHKPISIAELAKIVKSEIEVEENVELSQSSI